MVNNDLCSLWEQRLADHATSGKTIATWCREHSIRDNQFYYWRKKLRMDQVEHNHPVKWIPLEVEQTNLAPGSIAVHVGQATVEIRVVKGTGLLTPSLDNLVLFCAKKGYWYKRRLQDKGCNRR